MSLLVTIATYHSQTKAEAARIHLAQEGIEAVLINESIVAMDWLLMNAIGGIKLQVASHDAERAAGYINALEGEQRERLKSQATEFIRFHCSECGQCIFKMDHHCPWINNCVGGKNMKFFL